MKTNNSLVVAVIVFSTFASNAFALLKSPHRIELRRRMTASLSPTTGMSGFKQLFEHPDEHASY